MSCDRLTEYAHLWLAFPGEPQLLREIWQHKITCADCENDKRRFDEWREQRAIDHDEQSEGRNQAAVATGEPVGADIPEPGPAAKRDVATADSDAESLLREYWSNVSDRAPLPPRTLGKKPIAGGPPPLRARDGLDASWYD